MSDESVERYYGGYLLDKNGEPYQIRDIQEWGRAWESPIHRHRRVIGQYRKSVWFASTVFLGLDHNLGYSGPPILFETMVFERVEGKDVGNEIFQMRYRTRDEAYRGHVKVTEFIRIHDDDYIRKYIDDVYED